MCVYACDVCVCMRVMCVCVCDVCVYVFFFFLFVCFVVACCLLLLAGSLARLFACCFYDASSGRNVKHFKETGTPPSRNASSTRSDVRSAKRFCERVVKPDQHAEVAYDTSTHKGVCCYRNVLTSA